jgi:defect-in-organelle-trafficking protein DotC
MQKKCVLLSFLLLSACASRQPTMDLSTVDTTNFQQLENVYAKSRTHDMKQNTLSDLRIKALQDIAMTIGAQSGLAWSSGQINMRLEKDSKYLGSIYNFYALVLDHGVMPPVLEVGDNSLNLANHNNIRVADRTYKIVKQAEFTTTPPNWREYIWLNYTKPTLPDSTLLPKTAEERAIWRRGIKVGWEKGIVQAYSIFQQNLARLKRDYKGMLLYRKLLLEKMISPPFVARTELGITGDGTDMRVNDQVLRIVELPQLQTNSKNWNAIVVNRHE